MFLEKYPNEITSKLKKKFPDMIQPRSNYSKTPHNYLEASKINKMKDKIDKMFE